MSSWIKIIGICTFFGCIASTASTPISAASGGRHDTNSTNGYRSKAKSLDDYCLTPACIDTASRILKSMNPKVKPCDDFYEFVCGNYGKTAALSDSHLYSLPIHASMQEVDLRLQSIIEDIDTLNAPKPFARLKLSYNDCMKEKWKEDIKSGARARVNRVKISNTWRSLSAFKCQDPPFDKLFIIPYIFKYEKWSGLNTSFDILTLMKKEEPITFSYLRQGMSDQIVQDYFIFMKKVAAHLGAEKWQVAIEMPNILAIEIELANILFRETKTPGFHQHFGWTTVGDLVKMFPNLRLKEFLGEPDDLMVRVNVDEDVMRELDEWISGKSLRTLAYWLAWQSTVEKLDKLGPYVARMKEILQRTVYGFSKKDPKWRRCVEQVRSNSPFLMDVLYYGQHVSDSVVRHSTEIVNNVKQQFIGFIEKANWLSTNTKRIAVEKVEDIKQNVGIYEEFMLNKAADPLFVDLKLSDGLLTENRANITKIWKYLIQELSNTSRANDEEYDFVRWQAQYVGGPNLLRVGAVSYTDNFYNADRPEALNYAGFGFWVGHELAHSLDDSERLFNVKNSQRNWWDARSNKIFRERVQCLIHQYRRYGWKRFGLHLNSFKTRNEDLADNVGAKMVYFAYDKFTKGKKPEKQLPGLDYSPKQIFWIGLATNWCSKYRSQTERIFINEDTHSMEKFRINIPLSNIPEFANDFKCPVGSRMNPVKKCTVW